MTIAEIQSPLVEDNLIHLFYIIEIPKWNEFSATDTIDLGSIAGAQATAGTWLRHDWKEALISTRYADLSVWHQDGADNLSRDFLPPVAKLLSGSDPERLRRFRLNDEVKGPLRQLLKGAGLSQDPAKAGRREKLNLTIDLPKRAKERLALFTGCDDDHLRLDIGEPQLLWFRSGTALLDVPVSLSKWDRSPVHAEQLIETVKTLARHNVLRWRNNLGEAIDGDFSLGSIARPLLEGRTAQCKRDRRVYTCTFGQIEEQASDSDLARIGLFLARHLTEDYTVGGLNQPYHGALFADVERVASAEGSAVVVRRRDEVEFLRDYRNKAFNCAYLPLVHLALHEQAALLRIMDDATRWQALAEAPEAELAALERVRTDAMQLRLAFAFARVSLMANHEEWRDALEGQLRLPALRAGLAHDMAAIEGTVRAAHEARRQTAREMRRKDLAWAEGVGGGFVVTATFFSVLKDVIAPSFSTTQNGQTVAGAFSLLDLQFADASTLAAAISIAICAFCGWWVFRRARD